MSTSLADLDSRFYPIAETLIAQLRAEFPITVVTTGRTPAQQADNVANGVSWTTQSKHLPQPPEGKSWAIDLAPTELIPTKNWSPKHPLWWKIASAAVALGLRSGMDWNGIGLPPVGKTRPKFDPGHCEWKGPTKHDV